MYFLNTLYKRHTVELLLSTKKTLYDYQHSGVRRHTSRSVMQ
jgi:hypothetical protein